MLDNIVLGMLMELDLTGYDLKKCIQNKVGVFYKASYGSLYPALKKMTDAGLLEMTEAANGSRGRKVYRITDTGKAHFLNWLSTPQDEDDTNNRLVKVYFFDRLPEAVRAVQLAEYERKNLVFLEQLLLLKKQYATIENQEKYYYKLSTLYYGIAITTATIRWCRRIQRQAPAAELLESEVM